MAVLMGYCKDDVVYFCTDTLVVDDNRKRNELEETNFKFQKLDNGIIYGATYNKMLRQFLNANDDIFQLDKNNNLTFKQVISEIVPKLYFRMKNENFLINDKDEHPRFAGEILIGYKGNLFEICSQFVTFKYEKYQAVGEMSDYVQDSISSIDDSKDIETQLVEACKIAAKNSRNFGGPYITINTRDMEYKIWEN